MSTQESDLSGVRHSLEEWVQAEDRFSNECRKFVEAVESNIDLLPEIYQIQMQNLIKPFRDLSQAPQQTSLGSITSSDDAMNAINQFKESLIDSSKEASHQQGIKTESQLNSLMHKIAELDKDCFKKMVCQFEGKEKKIINPKYFDKVAIELTQQLAKRKEISGNICKMIGKLNGDHPELKGFAQELQTLVDKYGGRVNSAKGENVVGAEFDSMRAEVQKGLEKLQKSSPQYGEAIKKAQKLLKAIDFDGTKAQSKNAMQDVAFALGGLKLEATQMDRANASGKKKGGLDKVAKIEKAINKSGFNKFNQKQHAASYQDMQSKASVELKAASIQPAAKSSAKTMQVKVDNNPKMRP